MRLTKLFFLLCFLICNSCGTVEKAFTNNKKNSSDEFLVEKKSPLVMPPNYDELPIPKSEKNKKNNNQNNIKNLISNSDSNTEKKNIQNNDKSFEKNLIEKIKKN